MRQIMDKKERERPGCVQPKSIQKTNKIRPGTPTDTNFNVSHIVHKKTSIPVLFVYNYILSIQQSPSL